MKDSVFELCVECLESALAAERGGANRIELCADLSAGGRTPGQDLMKATIEALSIPVHVMIQPIAEVFAVSDEGFAQMREQIGEAKQAGAAGVVFGVLAADRTVDVERSRILVDLARPMKVTFHRAFDATPDLSAALEAVILTGADCLLTSGGKPDILTGASAIAQLRKQADGRIDVMAGGGLTLENLIEVVERTDVSLLHGSLTRPRKNTAVRVGSETERPVTQEADVREAIRLFRLEQATGKIPAQMVL